MSQHTVTGEVRLDSERCAAGDAVRGEVIGDHAEVRLVRVETTPIGECPLVVATAEVLAGRFELPLSAKVGAHAARPALCDRLRRARR